MKALMALALGAALVSVGGIAHASQAGMQTRVKVSHAWIRVLPGALPAGGYAVISNTGSTEQTLVGASSPAYNRVMLHQSMMQHGMSHMRMVKRLPVPAHATVKLAPGGYHLMFMHAVHPVKPGDEVPVTLHFANGNTLKVDFLARPANATGAS